LPGVDAQISIAGALAADEALIVGVAREIVPSRSVMASVAPGGRAILNDELGQPGPRLIAVTMAPAMWPFLIIERPTRPHKEGSKLMPVQTGRRIAADANFAGLGGPWVKIAEACGHWRSCRRVGAKGLPSCRRRGGEENAG